MFAQSQAQGEFTHQGAPPAEQPLNAEMWPSPAQSLSNETDPDIMQGVQDQSSTVTMASGSFSGHKLMAAVTGIGTAFGAMATVLDFTVGKTGMGILMAGITLLNASFFRSHLKALRSD